MHTHCQVLTILIADILTNNTLFHPISRDRHSAARLARLSRSNVCLKRRQNNMPLSMYNTIGSYGCTVDVFSPVNKSGPHADSIFNEHTAVDTGGNREPSSQESCCQVSAGFLGPRASFSATDFTANVDLVVAQIGFGASYSTSGYLLMTLNKDVASNIQPRLPSTNMD